MKHFLLSLLALCLLAAAPATAPALDKLAMGGFGAGNNLTGFWQADAGPTYQYHGEAVDGSNLTTYTFASHPIGAAGVRLVVLTFAAEDSGGTQQCSSATVGGLTATEVIESPTDNNNSCIYQIDVTSGHGLEGSTTADITLTMTNGVTRASVSTWTIRGLGNTAADDTCAGAGSSDPISCSTSLDMPANSVAIAVACFANAGTVTWDGVTGDDDEYSMGGGDQVGVSSLQPEVDTLGATVTATVSSSGDASVAAAVWNP